MDLRCFPLGESLPSNDIHAVSVSIPSWGGIVKYMSGDKELHAKLQCDYPRNVTFYQHLCVQRLNEAVLARVNDARYTRCMVFPSTDGMMRCKAYLRTSTMTSQPIGEVSFYIPQVQAASGTSAGWFHFCAVLFNDELMDAANQFWGFMGDGISSRHAEACLKRFSFMESVSSEPRLQTPASRVYVENMPTEYWELADASTKHEIKQVIAGLLASQTPPYQVVNPEDVFLYPKGMCAIGAVARQLVPISAQSSEVVIFGWPYGSTPKCVQISGYERFTFFHHGTAEELDELETKLAAGHRIACLFCEIPSNPLCATPDLHRLRSLANQYEFIVVCDETIGTFVNVDVLPLVDVVITSLTKLFSGGCNVMGGSVVLNSKSAFYDMLKENITSVYEDLVFPLDAEILLQNCRDFRCRVQKANSNALAIANFLDTQTSISHVNYPTMVASASLYERYRRPEGGYGSLISLVFKSPDSAVHFYDNIDVCKGPSFGANFTLVLPYSQLAHAFELDWAESQGISKHIIRISVGLEDENILIKKFDQALQLVKEFECCRKE